MKLSSDVLFLKSHEVPYTNQCHSCYLIIDIGINYHYFVKLDTKDHALQYLAFLKVKAPTLMVYLNYFQERVPNVTQAHGKMQSLLHYLNVNTNLEEEDVAFCFERKDINFTYNEKKELVCLFSSAFSAAHCKLSKYVVDGAQPASKFLDQVQVLDPRNLIDVDHVFNSIDSIPGFEAVSKDEWELYVNNIGPHAVKQSKDGNIDLTLFWKSKASNLPELYKIASCYSTTTIRSYDVERSFSAYNDILDEKRRSLDESTIRAFHFLNWNLRMQSSIEQEKEKQDNPQNSPNVTKETVKVIPEKKCPVSGEASGFPRVFKVVQEQRQQPEVPEVPTTTDTSSKESKRKITDVADQEDTKTVPKKKKTSVPPGKQFRTSLDKYLDAADHKKENNADAGSQLSTNTLQCTPALRVHYGLHQSTAQKFNKESACVFAEHREPLLSCLLNGSVKFKGRSVLDDQDLQRLYGCKPCDEDNYLTNFAIEAYLHLIANEGISNGMKVELFGWESFEKGFSQGPLQELVKGKAHLMEQDMILVLCNPGQSKHWFLLAVLPREKKIIVLDSKAGSFTKPTTQHAIEKMWRLLQQVDNHLDAKHWLFATNTPKDVPQQPNSFDCGVFLCFFARSLVLQSPVPNTNSVHTFRRHMILELHEQKLDSFTQPSTCIQGNKYYAVEYQKTYYFGRALESPDGAFINFKFLHSTVSSGEREFYWPRRDDIDRVHSSCVFFGPVVIVGAGPFTFPQSSEVEHVYYWLRKSRKGT